MKYRYKLFSGKNPYDVSRGEKYFLAAMRDNLKFQIENCPKYAEIARAAGFTPECLQSEDDLYKIPPVTTLYLKRNRLFSLPENRLVIKASSSGTKGERSKVGFDLGTLGVGLGMIARFFAYHGVISPRLTNYIVLGYEPDGRYDAGATKTAYGTTFFAPALHREYALKSAPDGYALNIDGIKRALLSYAEQRFPVRFIGFPPYVYFLCRMLKEEEISLKLHEKSRVLVGGGWKQYTGQQVDREELLSLIEETLVMKAEQFTEFYSAVEHPLAYVKCSRGHFHLTCYSRAIIRSAYDLSPLPDGEEGLLNLLSPLVLSMPIQSILTDDMAISGKNCSCGLKTPYFDLCGRAGSPLIKTCAAGAAELLRYVK